MKLLTHIISTIPTIQIVGNNEVSISKLAIDSREVEKGSLFFAQKGTKTDGHQYINQAIQQGALAIICEELPKEEYPEICFVQVKNVASVIGLMASAFYDYPTKELKVIGVTGTNGKTTIATLLFNLFKELGYNVGLVSTVQHIVINRMITSTHTTPNPIILQDLFRQMVEEGCEYAFMEVSSHAIDQHRIRGIDFDGAVFSNISHDHLDYHHTFNEYINAKKAFFDDLPKHAFALSNKDDKRGAVMLQNTKAKKQYYSIRSMADFRAKVLVNDQEGLLLQIENQEVHFLLSGLFNAYNLLAVYGTAMNLNQDSIEVLSILSKMKGAAGRFETYRSLNQHIIGIVDYAHTPDALLNVLSTIKQFETEGKVITVVGCGGDRDKSKRPVMAQVACEYSNQVILTSDNPRTENPEAILDDMERELTYAQKKKVIRLQDRKEAIKLACQFANEGDIILIAGKGHENYQEINGVKHHFDDKEILLEMFQMLGK